MTGIHQIIKLYKKQINLDVTTIPCLHFETAYSYKVFRPTFMRTGLDNSERVKRILWYLITMGRLRIFYILDGDRVVHYSFIIPKNFRFPFMNKGDLQIGPCFTNPNYRGQGLYAQALKLIPLFFFEQTNTFWIYTIDKNVISQHVIEKAGFSFQGLIRSYGFMRVLKTIKD